MPSSSPVQAPQSCPITSARSMPSASSSASASSASRALRKSPSSGQPLQPCPRRSGQISRCRSPASTGQSRRQISKCCGQPCRHSTGGASSGPVSATWTRTPVGSSWWAWRTPGKAGSGGAITPICHPASPHEASIDHGNHRPGRVVPGGAAAGEGLRGPRHGPPRLDGEVRAHRAPARPDHPPPGRSARPPQPRRRPPRLQPGRGLQPRRDVVRGGLLDPADAHGRVHRRRRHAPAGGRARGLPRDALLPGLLERDVRQGAARRRRPRRRRSTRARPTASRRPTATTSRSTTASPTTCSPARGSSSTTSRRAAGWSS